MVDVINKLNVILVITCALGKVHTCSEGWLKKINIKEDLTKLQKTCWPGIASTLRLVLNTRSQGI